jgi:hypothetical protein
MKPSDFFLSRRQFLGFLVPGALWIASGLWICGRQPLRWLETASGVRLAVVLVASYLIGYVLQSAIFTLMDETSRWRKASVAAPALIANTAGDIALLREYAREIAKDCPKIGELNNHQFSQFCKRFAAKDSEFFQGHFSDCEDEVNFTKALSIPLIILGLIAGLRYWFPDQYILPEPWCYGSSTVLVIGMGIYMFWRFTYARKAEEEAWYRAFIITWHGLSAPAVRNAPERSGVSPPAG